jgi:2-polyprenyl-3-methyl-5-hydroxy-6-metoxy-1,4-benzoquinol methylase
VKTLDRLLQRIRIRAVAPWVAPGTRVLDIGCADGALRKRLTQISSYVGVDPDAPSNQGGGLERYLRGSFPNAALEAERAFDVVTALAVLEHIPEAEQPAFARAVHERLTPGGLLLITVPSPLVDPILDALIRLRILDGMESEAHYGFDPKRTTRLFCDHGFELLVHERFELGLNHLFVFRRASVHR